MTESLKAVLRPDCAGCGHPEFAHAVACTATDCRCACYWIDADTPGVR